MGSPLQPGPTGGEPWPYNPLVTLIRLHGTTIISDTVADYRAKQGFATSHFDLAVQIMIVACSYAPDEIWLTDGDDVAIATELVEKGAARAASEVLEHGIASGGVRLNCELIEAIAADQAARLHEIHLATREKIRVPEPDGQELSSFPPGAELSTLRLTRVIPRGDTYGAVAIEKRSGVKVIFRPIDLRLSRAYVESFHYLHAARDDDSLSFGAIVEGEEMPFAMVSYAPVGRPYKHVILNAAGLDPGGALELTRAWNSESSPKNTLSMLFAYAHASILLLNTRRAEVRAQSILTAVNPNLGFRGSAFRAVGFGVIGEKPTAFHYVMDRNARRSYVPRRNLPAAPDEPPHRARIIECAMPLLPTKELAVILNGRSRSRPGSTVYRVSADEYRRL